MEKGMLLTNPKERLVPPLKPFRTEKPFEPIICVDTLEMDFSATGMRYILILVDHSPMWLWASKTKRCIGSDRQFSEMSMRK